jgi:hypothetical protein
MLAGESTLYIQPQCLATCLLARTGVKHFDYPYGDVCGGSRSGFKLRTGLSAARRTVGTLKLDREAG